MTITTEDIRIELEEYKATANVTPTHVGEYFARFMSLDEYDKLMKGVRLVNERDHASHAHTMSVGFCFMPITSIEDAEQEVSDAYDYLEGIVSDECAVIFRNESAAIEDSFGVYADPGSDLWDDFMCVDEFCTDTYDKYSMVPVKVIFGDRDPYAWRAF